MSLTVASVASIPPPTATVPAAAAAIKAAAPTPVAAPNARAAAPPPAPVTTASSTHQQAALNQLLATYTRDLSRGLPPHTISALGKQITTAAKVLGKYVTLPTAAATAAAPPVANVEPAVGKVNVTA